jgi:paraquat-inducible protein A
MPIPHPHSLYARARGLDRALPLALAAALGLLVAGWSVPLMTVSQLVLFEERVALLDAAVVLYRDGEWLLFAAIALFALAFPLIKLAVALVVLLALDARRPRLARALDLLDWLGRWSMLDVFVAALLVVGVKASLIGEVTLHAGLYLFTAAVILSMLCTQRLRRLARLPAS